MGTLGGWGCLDGTFASTEGSQSLRYWYLSPLSRVEFEAMPDYVFVATHLQTQYPKYHDSRLKDLLRVGEVRVRNEPRIEIWAREPLAVPYTTYDSEEFADLFDGVVPTLGERPSLEEQALRATLGEAVTLESAGLERTSFARGDTLHLSLMWRPEQALTSDYKVFVHVADESGRLVTQWDGLPCLNTARTSQWVVGEPVLDHVLIRIPEDVPRGEYSLLVGLYDGTTGERLGGQAVEVTKITVR